MNLIGREKEISGIFYNIAMKRHTLLRGDAGSGKTAILKYINENITDSIYMEKLNVMKEPLINIIEDKLRIVPPKALSISKCKDVITEHIKGKVLLIDDLESITPTGLFFLNALKEKAVIVGAANKIKTPSLFAKVFIDFEEIHIGNFLKDAVSALIWQEIDVNSVDDKRALENQIYLKTAGNPLLIKELLNTIKNGEGANKVMDIKDKGGGGVKDFDLTPLLLIIGALIISTRFIALGLDDVDTYILAGILGSFFIIFRYFIYRFMRSK